MAWLSRVNFTASDVLSYTDLNNLGNDIRAWGGNVNGGGYTLSNVVLSASSGTMATVIGGTGTTSTLTLRSTSGVGTTGADIVFQTGNNGATEVMRLQNGGNVGIGTASPADLLNVRSDQNASTRIRITNASTGSSAFSILALQNSTDADAGILRMGSNSSSYSGANSIALYTVGAYPIGFVTNNLERMRILSTGEVGIGTASPLTKLHVAGGTAVPVAELGGILITGNTSAKRMVMGVDSTSTMYSWIQSVENGVAAQSLSLNPLGGNVGIGTASPAYQLELSTDSAAKPTTNTWTIASDARLKIVKGEYAKGLAEICQIRPVRYEYNGKGGFSADGAEQISILAQELAQVFPECVGTFKAKLNESDVDETELYNYNGHAITFALINAIKELKAEIDLLKSRN